MSTVTVTRSYFMAIFLLVWTPVTVMASENSAISFYIAGGYEEGGDVLSERQTIGPFGGNYEAQASGGYRGSVGIVIDLHHENLNGDLVVTIGNIASSNSGSTGSDSVETLNLLYRFDMADSSHLPGIGLVYHKDPRYIFDEVSGCTSNNCITTRSDSREIEFDDALGLSLNYEYLISTGENGIGTSVGVRYTIMDYKSDELEVKASGFGIFVSVSISPSIFR